MERPPLPLQWTAFGPTPFVGRRQEVGVLRAAWQDVTSGAGRAIFVGGEPGGGKSRLAAEIAQELHRSGATVLLGSCVAELGTPYEPFGEPVAQLVEAIEQRHLLDDGATAGASQATVDLLRSISIPGSHPVEAERAYQRGLYDAVVAAFRAAAVAGPVILVVEDLHWAGGTTVELLKYLVERTTDVPILIVGTLRTGPTDRSSSLADAIGGLHRLEGVRRIDLAPLTRENVEEYVARQAVVSARTLPRLAELLHQHTGGNPFFVRMLWRDLADRTDLMVLDADSVNVPESVRETLEGRLTALSPETNEVLELAAVLGQVFDVVELMAVSTAPADLVLSGVDAGVALGLVERLVGEDGLFQFPHAIARQLFLDRMPASVMATRHLRVAQTLERDFPVARHRVQRLAHHYASARGLGSRELAVRYLTEAAEIADRSLAHEDAAHLYERASKLVSAAGPGHDLQLRAARSYSLAGDFARARQLDEEVAESGDPRQRLRAGVGFEMASWRPGLLGHRAVVLLQSALEGVEPDPADPLYVRGLASLGRATAFVGAADDADMLSERAIDLARALGNEAILADVLQTSITLGVRPGGLAVRLLRVEELGDLARASGNMDQLGSAGYIRSLISYFYGDLDRLRSASSDLDRACRQTGGLFWDFFATSLRYGIQFAEGRLTAASETCSELLEMGSAFGSDDTEGMNGLQMFMVQREAGALQQVRPLLTGLESPAERWAPGLLALYTELRMDEPARRILRWLMERESEIDLNSADWPARLAFMIEAACALEDVDAARRLRPYVEEFAGLNLLTAAFSAVFGSADRYAARLDSLLGSGSPPDLFDAALALDIKSRASLHQAETLAQHAAHLRRTTTDPARAEDLTERARAIAEPLNLRRVLDILPAPAPNGGVPGRPDGLTAREVDVLRLLGQGASNRDISEALVITENTAANHVRSILMKTRASNRTQAAIYAGKHGLL